jgi:hypothetical protein
VARIRERDSDQTARRQIDVEAAFAEENPTIPRHSEARALSRRPEALGPVSDSSVEVAVENSVEVVAGAVECESSEPGNDSRRDSEPVPSMVPLDVVPALAVPRAEVPWKSLGELATQLLLRIDGSSPAMAIVTGLAVPPNEGARELAVLVRSGLVRLEAPPSASPADDSADATGSELELDLSVI